MVDADDWVGWGLCLWRHLSIGVASRQLTCLKSGDIVIYSLLLLGDASASRTLSLFGRLLLQPPLSITRVFLFFTEKELRLEISLGKIIHKSTSFIKISERSVLGPILPTDLRASPGIDNTPIFLLLWSCLHPPSGVFLHVLIEPAFDSARPRGKTKPKKGEGYIWIVQNNFFTLGFCVPLYLIAFSCTKDKLK